MLNIWVLLVGIILIWVSYISIPPIVKLILQTISSLVHTQIISGFIAHTKITNPLITSVVALIGSLLIWEIIKQLQALFYQIKARY